MLQRSSGLIGLREAGVESNARGFQDIQAFIAGASVPLSQIAIKSLSIDGLLTGHIDIRTVFANEVDAAPLDYMQPTKGSSLDGPAVDLSDAMESAYAWGSRTAESTSMSLLGFSSEQALHSPWNHMDNMGSVEHGWRGDTIEVASLPGFDLMQVYREANRETDESSQALMKYLEDEEEWQTLCHDLIAQADDDWENGLREQVFADL
jgi:hypothetical protein